MTFTIKRSKWLRGSGDGVLLSRYDGKQCCIGMACSQVGVPDIAMLGYGSAASIVQLKHPGTEAIEGIFAKRGIGGFYIDISWVDDAYLVNDAEDINDDERELRLREIVASAGHEFVFVD